MQPNTRPYLVGFFNVQGHGAQTVATPLTGIGQQDMNTLWTLIRDKFPDTQIDRTGSVIEQRDDSKQEQGVKEYPAGATIQQLFDRKSDVVSFTIGTCVFHGSECNIIVRFHHARNAVGVCLLERATHTTIRFGGSASGQRLASELPKLVQDIIGNEGRDYKWKLVEV